MHRSSSSRVRIRMVAEPASVPAARRFVDDALAEWGRESFSHDASLCVTELSTNATLHSGSRFFEVELEQLAGSVRVSVADDGEGPLPGAFPKVRPGAVLGAGSEGPPGGGSLSRGPGGGSTTSVENTSTTGRGLVIVSALARAWGVDEVATGKRVWAEISADETGRGADGPVVTRRAPSDEGAVSPGDWTVVTLAGCPVALALAHDDNLAAMIRELQLITANPDDDTSGRLASLMSHLVQRHATTWDAGRLIARDAVATGREFLDIEVATPTDVAEDVRALRSALREADALAETGELITLPASGDVQGVRDWMAGEFTEQTLTGRAPLSYRSWLTNFPR